MKKIIIPLFLVITLCIIISSSNIGLIENQTWQSNLIGSTLSNGAVFGDIDNDDDIDVVATSWRNPGSIAWFENQGGKNPRWTKHLLKSKMV